MLTLKSSCQTRRECPQPASSTLADSLTQTQNKAATTSAAISTHQGHLGSIHYDKARKMNKKTARLKS